MLHYVKILLPEKTINTWQKHMKHGLIDYDNLGISSYQTVNTWTVECTNGDQIDLKLCSGNRNNGDPLWTECVLFGKNGQELACTEVSDTFADLYELECDDDKYLVEVVPMTAKQEVDMKSESTTEQFAINIKETNHATTVIQYAYCENGDQIIVELHEDNIYKHILTERMPNYSHNRITTIEKYCSHFNNR